MPLRPSESSCRTQRRSRTHLAHISPRSWSKRILPSPRTTRCAKAKGLDIRSSFHHARPQQVRHGALRLTTPPPRLVSGPFDDDHALECRLDQRTSWSKACFRINLRGQGRIWQWLALTPGWIPRTPTSFDRGYGLSLRRLHKPLPARCLWMEGNKSDRAPHCYRSFNQGLQTSATFLDQLHYPRTAHHTIATSPQMGPLANTSAMCTTKTPTTILCDRGALTRPCEKISAGESC